VSGTTCGDLRGLRLVDTVGRVNAANERRGADPAGLAALAGAGTIAAHELGYLIGPITGSDTSLVSHAHLAVLGPIALIALCVAGWSAALRVLRAGGGTPPAWHRLTLLQVCAYLALEVGERVVARDLGSLVSAPVVLGLALQPLIAWFAIRLLAAGAEALVRVFGASSPRPVAAALTVVAAPTAPLRSVWAPGRFRLRGPPMV